MTKEFYSLNPITPWDHEHFPSQDIVWFKTEGDETKDGVNLKHAFIVRLTFIKQLPSDDMFGHILTYKMKDVMGKENVPLDKIDTIYTIDAPFVNWTIDHMYERREGHLKLEFWAKAGDQWYGSDFPDQDVLMMRNALEEAIWGKEE